jgi:hypothetical protein
MPLERLRPSSVPAPMHLSAYCLCIFHTWQCGWWRSDLTGARAASHQHPYGMSVPRARSSLASHVCATQVEPSPTSLTLPVRLSAQPQQNYGYTRRRSTEASQLMRVRLPDRGVTGARNLGDDRTRRLPSKGKR